MKHGFLRFLTFFPSMLVLCACPGEPGGGAPQGDDSATDEEGSKGSPDELCMDLCVRDQQCNEGGSLQTCLSECSILRLVREEYYEPPCIEATDARLRCEASTACEPTDSPCDAVELSELEGCISTASPPEAVVAFCQYTIECHGSTYDESYECPEEYADDPYYGFYCDLSALDLCLFNFTESLVTEAVQYDCLEEYEAALTCVSQLECSSAYDAAGCEDEIEAIETACPSLYYPYP